MLSPTQQFSYDSLMELVSKHNIIGFQCQYGNGRTTILKQIAREKKAHFLRMANFFDQIKNLHPFQIEEGIAHTIINALEGHDVLVVDDFSIVIFYLKDCMERARPDTLELALDTVCRSLEQSNKQLILGLTEWLPSPLSKYGEVVEMPPFTVDDFSFLFQKFCGERLQNISFDKVFRFSPRLSAANMAQACQHLQKEHFQDTNAFIKFLEKHALSSNVDTKEVDPVTFNALFGADEVIRQLEINIITPLERSDLAQTYGLKPKRGVLLYGPPGTGKTTIGRALAHRLQSKFFLIDGTVISGTGNFYYQIQRTFQQAKDNSPSVIFIDDCDLLFENEEEPGLYRYLLTMLDGLESKSNAQITLVLTAMNIGSLPPALIRSGRVELWLEMKLPDREAREAIIDLQLKDFPLQLSKEELFSISEETKSLTGADLKRLITDAKNLLGYDLAQNQSAKGMYDYLMLAVHQLRKHKQQLEDAPAYTAAHQPKTKMNVA